MFTNLTYAPVIDTENGATPSNKECHLFAKHHAGYPFVSFRFREVSNPSRSCSTPEEPHALGVTNLMETTTLGCMLEKAFKETQIFSISTGPKYICTINSNFSATCASKIIVSIQSNFHYKFYIPTFTSYVYIATYHCIRLHRLYL